MMILFSVLSGLNSQAKGEKEKTALLIVDIQEFYFPNDNSPGLYLAEETSEVAKEVLQLFRDQKQLVVHVRHQAKKGFEIHRNVLPINEEKVITKTEVNSFNDTELLDYLKKQGVKKLVIIGMQTHMCLEAATRAAYDFGFDCTVIEDACTTRDLQFKGKTIKATEVHLSTLSTLEGGGYARVLNLKEFRDKVDEYLKQ